VKAFRKFFNKINIYYFYLFSYLHFQRFKILINNFFSFIIFVIIFTFIIKLFSFKTLFKKKKKKLLYYFLYNFKERKVNYSLKNFNF